MLTSRWAAATLCLIFAAVIAFVVMPAAFKDQSATYQIARIAVFVPKGEQIQEQHLSMAEVGAYNLPNKTLKTKEEIIGMYARTDLFPGDYVFPEKIDKYRNDAILDDITNQGKRLVTITPRSNAAGIAGHLQPGDIVSVALIREIIRQTDTIGSLRSQEISYPEELQYLVIYDLENQHGISVAADVQAGASFSSAGSGGASVDRIPKTITFIADEAQARMLIEAEHNGLIQLTFIERKGQ